MKQVGKSKVPLAHQLPIMVENLGKKFKVTVFLEIKNACYGDLDKEIKTRYRISFVPGLDSTACSDKNFETWSEVLDYYFKLVRS